jgi:bifunctional UDP-N-acetylglucosamine pyrophosphorylase/glucosamine-1-phosphate N-acetyltransferase
MPQEDLKTKDLLIELSAGLDSVNLRVGIVLAAGHGKRIRSDTSKMLHEIWGRPTAQRVADAVEDGLDSSNQVIVVGIKGGDVAQAIGRKDGRVFAYQENPVLGLPAGTGDAVRVGLDAFTAGSENRDVYIFLGDMGLLTEAVVRQFRRCFEEQGSDMMVLTGQYSGPQEQNSYGRIVRVPGADCNNRPSGEDEGKVIEIKEHKDILSLGTNGLYEAEYKGQRYPFSRDELLNIREINTGVFAFKENQLRTYISHIQTDNAQGELMLTDLVDIFNRNGLEVRAMLAEREEEILAFNVKSVWRQMEGIARRWVYQDLKDIITIVDEEDFFIADEVVDQILALDKDRGPLDIVVGKGVYIGPQVELNRQVDLGDRCQLSGHIILGERVVVEPAVLLSAYEGQTMVVEDDVEILNRNTLKGNMRIGQGSRIESGVILTGSDEYPMRIGRNVTIKGTSYLFGCTVDDGLLIEHSVIKSKHVHKVYRKDGSIQPIRYVLPQPEGLDSVGSLEEV